MKQRIILLLLTLAYGKVCAQWNPTTANSSAVIWREGKVGIGIDTPQKSIDVHSGYNDFVSFGAPLSLGQYTGIHFGYLEKQNILYRKSAIVFERLDEAARGKIHILNNGGWNTNSATLADSKFTIDFNGQVGIGLTSPEGKLHVKGVGYFGNENGDSWHRVAVGGSGGNYGSVGYGYKYTNNTHEHVYSVADYASQLRFDFGGFNFLTAPNGVAGNQVPFASVMSIKQDGNVGIGTASPAGLLEINGPYSGNSQLIINTTSSNAEMKFSDNGVAKGFVWYNKGTDQMAFGRGSGNNSLFINSSGNFGIGTQSPDAKLAVKGTIHTQEVRVDLNGAVAPDYVFNDDYKLLSLTEIKTYIDKNKHLPEVPSAKEMEANGVNLGEMNMLLLKKIEELTLHILKQQEQLNMQKEEINELKSKNN